MSTEIPKNFKVDDNFVKILKLLSVNELDPGEAEVLIGMLVEDEILFTGKNTMFSLKRIK